VKKLKDIRHVIAETEEGKETDEEDGEVEIRR
jgi:hypothetical protein